MSKIDALIFQQNEDDSEIYSTNSVVSEKCLSIDPKQS